MKTYTGNPADLSVTVKHDAQLSAGTYRLEPRLAERLGGMEWGYKGSGPATLARSLLWDHMGMQPTAALYMQFRYDFVHKWDLAVEWKLTSREIEDWIAFAVEPVGPVHHAVICDQCRLPQRLKDMDRDRKHCKLCCADLDKTETEASRADFAYDDLRDRGLVEQEEE